MSEAIHISENDSEEVPLEELSLLFENNGPVDFSSIDRIRGWVMKGSEAFEWADHYLDKRIDLIEDKFSEFLRGEKEVSLATLMLFGELTQLRDSNMVSNKLASALEKRHVSPSAEAYREMVKLSESGNENDRYLLHKILDFVRVDMLTCQNIEAEGKSLTNNSGFFASMTSFLAKKINKPRNYLVKKHVQDLIELRQVSSSPKEGALSGVPGGASDETIYTYRHVLDGYRNRIGLGINEGYPVKNPVLPIAPGFFGLYNNGRLANIFPDNGFTEEEVSSEENQYIASNNPYDDRIYEVLNDIPFGSQKNPSIGLVRLGDIFHFENSLKKDGHKFYYDLSKINAEQGHPFVVAELMLKNQQYKHKEGRTKNDSTPFPKDQFLKLIFPAGQPTPEQIYNFEYLNKLDMRKKIEDDFGLDLSEHDLWIQRAFLEFLETRDIENVEKLQAFVKEYGGVGLKTFLSLEYGRELGDDIIALGEKLPKIAAEKIFAKYGELVDEAGKAEVAVIEHFPEAKINPELVSAVRENLLKRGREMLVSFANRVEWPRSVLRELSLLRADAALFAATFKELSKRGEQISLAEIGSVAFEQGVSPDSFSPEDITKMKELYRINYKGYPKFQKSLLEGFDEALRSHRNQFYVLRYKGVIEGFYRLDITAKDKMYFGAFNMNPKYTGSGLGEAIMQQSLDVRAKDAVIEATCTATLPIASNYIERGFIGTKAQQDEEVYSMNIVRHDSKKEMFRSKAISDEEIIRTCGSGSEFACKKIPLNALAPEHFALLNERSEDGSRFVLTRYIRDKKTQSAYLVFEKTNNDAIEEFSTPVKPLPLEGQE